MLRSLVMLACVNSPSAQEFPSACDPWSGEAPSLVIRSRVPFSRLGSCLVDTDPVLGPRVFAKGRKGMTFVWRKSGGYRAKVEIAKARGGTVLSGWGDIDPAIRSCAETGSPSG